MTQASLQSLMNDTFTAIKDTPVTKKTSAKKKGKKAKKEEETPQTEISLIDTATHEQKANGNKKRIYKSHSSVAGVLSTELKNSLRDQEPLLKVSSKLKVSYTALDDVAVEKLADQHPRAQVEKKKNTQDDAGPGWFGLPATEMTDHLKAELQAIKMRGYIDPKRFYRSNDSHKMPKFFSVGTVVSGEGDRFGNDPTTRPSVKGGLVDELLADDKSKAYFKRKFKEVQAKKLSGGRLHLKQKQKKRAPAWRKNI